MFSIVLVLVKVRGQAIVFKKNWIKLFQNNIFTSVSIFLMDGLKDTGKQ